MSDAPVDMAVLADLRDSMGADFAAELVATFLQEAPGMIADLKAAAAAGAADDLRRAAHSIKSNAAIFGAGPLADIARDIELHGLGDGTLARIEAELDRAAGALGDVLDG
jgi:HPt (histidine-containing phosphotransfer) domain-containing protein